MGQDKAFVEINGERLWRRQLGILRTLQPRHLFIAGPMREEGAITLRDAVTDVGPLGGLAAALRSCSSRFLLTLAVDLPRMTSQYLTDLIREGAGVVPRGQPLAAVYPVSALTIAEACLEDRTFSMHEFVQGCLAAGLVTLRESTAADEHLFFNMNTPEDALALRHG